MSAILVMVNGENDIGMRAITWLRCHEHKIDVGTITLILTTENKKELPHNVINTIVWVTYPLPFYLSNDQPVYANRIILNSVPGGLQDIVALLMPVELRHQDLRCV